MSFNRTESARFAQENQKVVGELHAGVESDMFPRFAVDDMPDITTSNAKHFAKGFLGITMEIQRTNFKNLIVGEFAGGAIRSLIIWHIAMVNLIHHIFASCAPFKVFKKTIRPDSILVAALHLRGARSNKSGKNQSVYELWKDSLISHQIYDRVSSYKFWFKYSLWLTIYNALTTKSDPAHSVPERPHPSLVTYLVSREFVNRQPSFWSFVRECGKILGIHGRNLLLGFGWAEPVLLRKQLPARLIMT